MHRSLANDFALLFTESEFELAEHIDTVCLPQVLVDHVMISKMNMVNFNYVVDNLFCPDGLFCSLARSSTTRNVLPLVGARTNLELRASFRSTHFLHKK